MAAWFHAPGTAANPKPRRRRGHCSRCVRAALPRPHHHVSCAAWMPLPPFPPTLPPAPPSRWRSVPAARAALPTSA
ncbi:hypothetical protein ALSL_2587 [Aerosticca soli]|uniref:Uncharacterized protein n=1 Tax=Aerosticca soli TaxID=2010829 RepID=A0A2Z6E8S6_9GAMM|nr:hypothetical protein ALSL_2587 [Aerosticca soli]